MLVSSGSGLSNIMDSSWLSGTSVLVALVIGLSISHYFKNKYNYWKRLGIKGDTPLPFANDFYQFLIKKPDIRGREQVEKYGKIYGTFLLGKPWVVVADADVIRQITIKDFDVFQNHSYHEQSNKYQRNFLFSVQGEDWKRHRSLMSPTFTSGKIKRMFRYLEICADDLLANIGEQIDRAGGDSVVMNGLETFGMFTMDGISTCGYGLKLQRGSDRAGARDKFVEAAKMILRLNVPRLVLFSFLPTALVNFLGLQMTPESDFLPMVERVSKLIEIRKQSSKKHDDLLQLLLDARQGDQMELGEMDQVENHHIGIDDNKALHDERSNMLSYKQTSRTSKARLTDMEVLCEAIVLMAAGYDTTKILLTTCTYALAHHPDVQQRLFEEIKSISKARSGEGSAEFDYESLTSCEYLDAVVSESLRFLSPAQVTDRKAGRDYLIEKYNLLLPKGTTLFISISSVHADPDYWEEPEKFCPDRFLPGQRGKIVPGSYIPFSMGPRHCLGMRFALTEAKIGLAKTLLHYSLEPAPETTFPAELSRNGPGLIALKKPLISVKRRAP